MPRHTDLCYGIGMFADEAQGPISEAQSSAQVTAVAPYLVMALSFGALISEGYDVVVYGAAVPALLAYKPWSLTPAQVGSIGSATLFGMFFGAPAAGWLTDRFGRRRLFLGLLAFFSCMMILAALSPSPVWLWVFRFLAGLGFGGVTPTVVAMVNEVAPSGRKILFSGSVLTGVGCGGVLASIVASPLLRTYGFRGLFAAGALPLLTLVPLAAWLLPKSMDFRGAARPAASREQGSVRSWHRLRPFTRTTVLFVTINIFSLMAGAGLLTWFPQMLHSQGFSMQSALHSLIPLNFGTIAGALIGVWLADRVGGRVVIAGMFAVGAICLAMITGHVSHISLALLIFVGGAASGGVPCVLPSFMATLYPPDLRATSVGIASGLGRLGGAAGPFLAGALISAKVSYTGILLAFVAAEVIAGSLALFLPRNGIMSDGSRSLRAARL